MEKKIEENKSSKKGSIFWIIYTCIILAFTVYVFLDAFVIVKSYKVVDISDLKEITSDDNNTDTDTKIEKIVDDNHYLDENIDITITQEKRFDSNMYIADIKLSDLKYLKSAFAKSQFGKNVTELTTQIASNNNAIFAINCDFYGARKSGFVLRNGVWYRQNKQSDKSKEDLIIYNDGTFDIVNENNTDPTSISDAWQVISFGPGIIKDGEICVSKNSSSDMITSINPRTAIGMIEPLHYIVIVVEGRLEDSPGVDLYDLATIFKEYGVKSAYNLDGGGSSTMVFNGNKLNITPNGEGMAERSVSDILYVGY